ncbi:hypothetical protein BCR35DRAFT_302543 [Leucosporidium creatinivorum]|uniref:Uncharacterized protein n=1 Tax=Leucosporidium creatinivorum TaxID=106004 RepID=A0A1Y2FRY3_9BASI|nr:hypothetical protein BCR35DRAFT_302543 [Leucosporidium creatinivorum]
MDNGVQPPPPYSAVDPSTSAAPDYSLAKVQTSAQDEVQPFASTSALTLDSDPLRGINVVTFEVRKFGHPYEHDTLLKSTNSETRYYLQYPQAPTSSTTYAVLKRSGIQGRRAAVLTQTGLDSPRTIWVCDTGQNFSLCQPEPSSGAYDFSLGTQRYEWVQVSDSRVKWALRKYRPGQVDYQMVAQWTCDESVIPSSKTLAVNSAVIAEKEIIIATALNIDFVG